MIGIVLCGGKAERLGEITKTIPKAMLMLKGKPLLWYKIMWLKRYYITDIILCTGHLHQSIKNYFGNGRDLGVRIRYSVETEPLGTGGAVYNAFKFCQPDRPVIILNGDTFGEFNIYDMIYRFFKTKEPMIAAKKMINCKDYGTLKFNIVGRIVEFEEKKEVTNQFINTGVYMMFPSSWPEELKEKKSLSIEKDVFPILVDNANINIYKAKYLNNFWIDSGTPERLETLNNYLGGKY